MSSTIEVHETPNLGSLQPLSDLRIVAVEQYGAGPFSSMLLADLGAEVIKIEQPGEGDVARSVPPYAADGDSVYFQSLNRRKRSVCLETRTPEGQAVFRRLVGESDAVFNNLRGDQPSARGLDYASLRDVKPSIVCCHLNGFGRSGAHAAEPAYDYLMQGYAGWMSLTGEPGGPPQKSGLSLVDLSAGIAAGLGLVAAVRRAERTGVGGDVDVSLLDTALSMLTYVGAWHLTAGYEAVRQADSSHPSQIPSQILPTADGWLVVMCAKEKFYQRLVTLMGAPELATDNRFHDFSARLANRVELVELLKGLSRTRTTKDWLSVLRGHVPCAPVNTVAEAFEDPVVIGRDMIVETPHARMGTVRALNSPIHVSGEPAPLTPGPQLGQHTGEVLREVLGMDDIEIKSLVDAGAAFEGKE